MRRMLGALLVGLAAVAAAQAHALYLVPDAADPVTVAVVFGHGLAPDVTVKEATWKRFGGLKLSARDDAGKVTPVTFAKEKGRFRATVSAGTRVVFGQVEAGLYARGDATPKLVRYYPKAVVGPVPADGGQLGGVVELEIVPQVEAGAVRFQVLARGEPVPAATVSVIIPGKADEAEATTDGKGWTPAFTATGRYGVTCRKVESTAGELNGQKYDGISHTATLVVDVK